MNRSNLVLLRCRSQVVGNRLRAAFARGRRLDTSIVSAGLGLLLAYWAGTLLQRIEHIGWCRSHPGELSAGLLTVAALSGALAADREAKRIRRLARAPFLSVLPWSDNDRRHAMRLASMPIGCAGAVLAFMVGYAVCRACDVPHVLIVAGAASAVFGLAFLLATLRNLRTAYPPGPAWLTFRETVRLNDAVLRVAGRFDAGMPRWLGSWGLGRRATSVVSIWSVLLITLGVGGAAGGIIERSAGPAVIAAVLGGHAVFLVGLRAAPLTSGALYQVSLIKTYVPSHAVRQT